MTQDLLFHKVYTHPTSQEWVVLVHGAGGSSAIWFRQIKAYKKKFNLLLVDLRGHGKSKSQEAPQTTKKFGFFQSQKRIYTFDEVSLDVLNVLDHLKIEKCHMVGLSLGSIIVRKLAEHHPDRIQSMVLAGAVTQLNLRSRCLVKLGNLSKHIIPYMWTYKLFAYVVMPKSNQKLSRHLFIREARKLCQQEFKRWFKLSSEMNPMMRYFNEKETNIPTLYLMGAQDYMFIQPIKEMLKKHRKSSLYEIPDCGHVCNVEKPDHFNQVSISFIESQAMQPSMS